MIAQWLPFLPKNQRYQVIFIERDLEEILDSQRAMLKQLQKPTQGDRLALRATYLRQLAAITEWLDAQAHIDILYLRHGDVLRDPETEATRISHFLGGRLAIAPMAAVIDPALHRQRSEG